VFSQLTGNETFYLIDPKITIGMKWVTIEKEWNPFNFHPLKICQSKKLFIPFLSPLFLPLKQAIVT
jgi:hypothetical protein